MSNTNLLFWGKMVKYIKDIFVSPEYYRGDKNV
jgi:hypothetical protein